jgi:hypothetical protein
MGKAIGSIEKNGPLHRTRRCRQNRVQSIKDFGTRPSRFAKGKDAPAATNTAAKRQIESPEASPSSAKRVKVESDSKKVSSFSSLLKKVTSSAGNSGMKSSATAGASGNGVVDGTSDMGEKSNGSENKGE